MEMHDTGKTQSAALKWLYEMEALDSPVLRQNLYENVYMAHLGIKDCKLFITPSSTNQKGVLIWLGLKFWSKIFKKEEVYLAVTQVVNNLLPSYRVRIVADEKILELAEQKMREVYGGSSETTKPTDSSNDVDTSDESDKQSSDEDVPTTEASDILPNTEEQAEDKQEVRDEVEQLNPQVDEEIQSIVEDLHGDSDAGERV